MSPLPELSASSSQCLIPSAHRPLLHGEATKNPHPGPRHLIRLAPPFRICAVQCRLFLPPQIKVLLQVSTEKSPRSMANRRRGLFLRKKPLARTASNSKRWSRTCGCGLMGSTGTVEISWSNSMHRLVRGRFWRFFISLILIC